MPIGVRAPAMMYEPLVAMIPNVAATYPSVTFAGAVFPCGTSIGLWPLRLPLGNVRMQQILEAIQAGASSEEFANLAIPESYRAAFVKRDETAMFEGVDSWDKDPRKSLHVDDVATPELAPDEVYIAVMASSINFNTVWTSIFEPLPTFGFLDRLARESEMGEAARTAVPRRRIGRVRRGVEDRLGGSQLEAGRPRDRPLQLRRRPGSDRAQRLDARVEPADLGLRDELRCASPICRSSRRTS